MLFCSASDCLKIRRFPEFVRISQACTELVVYKGRFDSNDCSYSLIYSESFVFFVCLETLVFLSFLVFCLLARRNITKKMFPPRRAFNCEKQFNFWTFCLCKFILEFCLFFFMFCRCAGLWGVFNLRSKSFV